MEEEKLGCMQILSSPNPIPNSYVEILTLSTLECDRI